LPLGNDCFSASVIDHTQKTWLWLAPRDGAPEVADFAILVGIGIGIPISIDIGSSDVVFLNWFFSP
jgi:hypothetical protein